MLVAQIQQRRPYALYKDRAGIHIGQATETGWTVHEDDLIAPLPDTLAQMTLSKEELSRWQRGGADQIDLRDLIAGKEAVCHWLKTTGIDGLHPSQVSLLAMRPELFVVTRIIGQPADVLINHIGPTRFDLVVSRTPNSTTAAVRRKD